MQHNDDSVLSMDHEFTTTMILFWVWTMNLQQCQNQSCQDLVWYTHATLQSYIRLLKRVLILFIVEKPRSQSAVLIGKAKNICASLLRFGYTVEMVLLCFASDKSSSFITILVQFESM